jgi:hypothetical protein
LKEILLLIIKVKTFSSASSSVKSVVILLRSCFAKLGRKNSDIELLVVEIVVSIVYISIIIVDI